MAQVRDLFADYRRQSQFNEHLVLSKGGSILQANIVRLILARA